MGRFPQVRWAASALTRTEGAAPLTLEEPPDVLVLSPGASLGPQEADALAGGAGLVVVGAGPWAPEIVDLVARYGVLVRPGASEPTAIVPDRASCTGVTREDLVARVVDLEGTVDAHLEAGATGAAPFLRTPAGTVVGVVGARAGDGARAAVVAADLREGGSARHLLHNLTTWCAPAAQGPTGDDAVGPRPTSAPAVEHPAWHDLKAAVAELQPLQAQDGSVPVEGDRARAADLVRRVADDVAALSPLFPHDGTYLAALGTDLRRWADEGMGVPDFLDSLVAFQPQEQRVDGLQHLVVFPMYTQNGSRDRHLEAVVVEVIWPRFVADLEAGDYSNRLFVPIRFVDFTAGYDTNSAVLFPETVAMRSVPTFTWGAIFADREAARFRRVVRAAADTTGLSLPPDAARLLADQQLAEETFVMWDLIHDRTHMRGDLPFDPFMIKQRMPFFLYALEELRCDLTAFREAVALEKAGVEHARLVQYAVIFDRIFRFAITGSRVRNYDGLGGQLLFAWLHQHHVLHWTDNRLSIDWAEVPEVVLALGRQIEDLYWRSIDRPKIAHWLAAYELVATTVTPHPASTWAKGPDALPLTGPLKEMTDAVLPDEFPLSMFFEALTRRIGDVVDSTAGITGTTA